MRPRTLTALLLATTVTAALAVPAGATAKKAVKVTSGESHACAIKPNGRVLCWGDNFVGQASPPNRKFEAIDAGAFHNCGIRLNGKVACWGSNGHGESEPPSGKFRTISAGFEFSCGIKRNGKAKCWGTTATARCHSQAAGNSNRSAPVTSSPAGGSRTKNRSAGE